MFALEKGHAAAATAQEPLPVTQLDAPTPAAVPQPEPQAQPAPAPRLGLAWIDRMAATSFIGGSTDDLAGWTQDCARSLAGMDRNEARVRLLSRSMAAAAAQVLSLEVLLGRALTARDERAVALIDRTLATATKRLTMLVADHRSECAMQQRAVVVGVGHADRVTIKTGG